MKLTDRIGQRLRLRDLNIFLAVVENSSMSKAAAQLAVSQPVVSKAIADMENTLGVPLLDRNPRGVQPTLYGRALMKRGLAVFDELRQSVKDIEFLADPTVGEARIGCTAPLAAGVAPFVVDMLNRRHPRISFHVLEGPFSSLVRELRDRNIDLIIGRAPAPVSDGDMVSEVLFDDRLLVVAGSRNQWTRRKKINFRDLFSEPWVLPQPGSVATSLVDEAFRAADLEPPEAIRTSSMAFTIYLLAAGRFLSLMPESMVRFSGKHLPLRVLPVDLPLRLHPLLIVKLRNRTLSPAAQLFIGGVHASIGPLVNSNSKGRGKREAACSAGA